MLEKKKRYNANDVVAEFKRLMLVPYVVNYINEYERPKLKQFILADLAEKSVPGDKYYSMVIDWVKNAPNFDVIIRGVLSECVYNSQVRGRDGERRYTKWEGLRVMACEYEK